MTYRVITEADINALTELRVNEYNLRKLVDKMFPLQVGGYPNASNKKVQDNADYHIKALFEALSMPIGMFGLQVDKYPDWESVTS